MKVSACCFNDEELKQFIDAYSKEYGVCNYCNDGNKYKLLQIEDLKDFFSECLNLFIPNSKGRPLIEFLKNDLNLFVSSDNINIYKLLSDIISVVKSDIDTPDVKVNYNDEILLNINHWEELKENIKWRNRYIINANELSEEYGWDNFLKRTFELPKDAFMYRARIHKDSSIDKIQKTEMKCPPKEDCLDGRANPRGIPYLYLCKDIETTLYETRALYLDEVSIGKFKVNDGETIQLVDFTEKPSLFFNIGNIEEYVKSILLKREISKDLSKPLRRYDSVLEYIPTQFICEYIRASNGADGIIFNSSLHDSGKNIVLFNPNKVDCIDVEKYYINKVEINSNVS